MKVATYHLCTDNIAGLERLKNLDLVLLRRSYVLYADDTLPFSLQHRLANLLDNHNRLLGHQTHHAGQHDVVDVGQHLSLAAVAGHADGGQIIGSRSRNFVETLCRAWCLGRRRDADNAHERGHDVAVVDVRARARSVLGGRAKDFAWQGECGGISSHCENLAV